MKLILLLLTGTLLFQSCNKSEKIEAKLIGEWRSEKVYIDGEEWKNANNSIILKFRDDFFYAKVYESGQWTISDDGKSILFESTLFGSYIDKILKINRKELWIEHEESNLTFEYHLVRE